MAKTALYEGCASKAWAEQNSRAGYNLHRITNDDNSVTIRVKQLPEGVFLATSDEVPGLTVEFDTRDEIIATAPEIALELLEIEAGHPLPQRPAVPFAFD